MFSVSITYTGIRTDLSSSRCLRDKIQYYIRYIAVLTICNNTKFNKINDSKLLAITSYSNLYKCLQILIFKIW